VAAASEAIATAEVTVATVARAVRAMTKQRLRSKNHG
jgi:hypothetical protein